MLSVCIELLNAEQHRTAGAFATALLDTNNNCGVFTNLTKSLDIFLLLKEISNLVYFIHQ